MNIITNIESTSSTVYIVWKNYSVIEMEYNKNPNWLISKLVNFY